jgi:hypothetical protein
MKIAFVIIIVCGIIALLEWQIITVTTQRRQDLCSIHVRSDGTLTRATDWEYYDCITK